MDETHARPEPHDGDWLGRLSWLRAGVLGANDGIVSVEIPGVQTTKGHAA